MFTTLCMVLAALFSTSEPTQLDWEDVAEHMGFVEPAPVASVQLDLLPDGEGAEHLAEQLRETLASSDLSLDVRVEIVAGELDLPPSYRVGLGPFSSFEEAEQARAQLEGLGLDGFVRAHDEFVGC